MTHAIGMRCRVQVLRHFDDRKHGSVLPDPSHLYLSGQPLVDGGAASKVGGHGPSGARQSVHGNGRREGVVQSGTEERDNRVTAVFLIGRQGGHTAHPCSMTRSPVGTRSNLQAT